eukprot:1860255-Pyramimonas_sp.AAC.1
MSQEEEAVGLVWWDRGLVFRNSTRLSREMHSPASSASSRLAAYLAAKLMSRFRLCAISKSLRSICPPGVATVFEYFTLEIRRWTRTLMLS